MQIESKTGGMWRYPLKLIAIEPPPDDTIIIEVSRLNREFLVGFKLTSKIEWANKDFELRLKKVLKLISPFNSKPLPFKAQFLTPGDQVFSVYPSAGEILPESEDGTLFKVGFTSPSYGKVYQSQLIISVKLICFCSLMRDY